MLSSHHLSAPTASLARLTSAGAMLALAHLQASTDELRMCDCCGKHNHFLKLTRQPRIKLRLCGGCRQRRCKSRTRLRCLPARAAACIRAAKCPVWNLCIHRSWRRLLGRMPEDALERTPAQLRLPEQARAAVKDQAVSVWQQTSPPLCAFLTFWVVALVEKLFCLHPPLSVNVTYQGVQ